MKELTFGKQNYLLIGGGFLLSIIGFVLMAGGKAEDPNIYNPDVFHWVRITLAPLTILSGYGIVLYGILRKDLPAQEEAL